MTITLQDVLLRWSIFFLSPSLCVPHCFFSTVYSFPPVDKATWFRWLPRAANRSPTAIATDPTLGCAARLNQSKLDEPASMDGRRFQKPPAVGQFLSSGCTVDLSEDGGIFDYSDGRWCPPPQEYLRPFRAGGASRHR